MTIQAKLLSNRVVEILGHGHSKGSIIASALVALLIFFYIFSLSSYLGIEIFVLKNRITYASNFHYYLISDHLDKIGLCISASSILLLIFRKKIEFVASLAYVIAAVVATITIVPYLLTGVALLSFPWIVCLLVYSRIVKKDKVILHPDRRLVKNYLSIAMLFLGFESLILSIVPILSPSLERPDSQNYAYLIFALFSSSSPILLSLLVFRLPTKILIDEIVSFIMSIKKRTIGALSTIDIESFKMKSRTLFIFLSLIVLLSIALAATPHIPSINRQISRLERMLMYM